MKTRKGGVLITLHAGDPRPEEYVYPEMTKLYTKQELLNRLDGLFRSRHLIELKSMTEVLTSYDVTYYTKAKDEIESIMNELLRDFSK